MPRLCVTLAALSVATVATVATAQTPDLVPGHVTERVVSAFDSTQSHAVYLPGAYDTTRAWPIVFIMDPRGRATHALEPLRAAAERFGYILVSSYNTLSDGPAEPNVIAMNAMLDDAQSWFRLDLKRFYLAGFSGTARVAWDFARQMEGAVAGIYGVGAGIGGGRYLTAAADPPQVAFFGSAGNTDFNYWEMHEFERWVARWGVPYRFRFFDGPHAWAPDTIASQALAWFELRAIRSGLRPLDPLIVDSLLRADLSAARALERSGHPADALGRYREIVADYEGPVADSALQRIGELESDRTVERTLKRRQEHAEEFGQYRERLVAWVLEARRSEDLPRARDGIRTLRIEQLRETTARSDDPEEVTQAERQLRQAFATLSFYEPRDLLLAGQPERALIILDVADAISSDHPNVLVWRARAFVQLGRTDDALTALERALAGGLPASSLDNEAFTALRSEPRFQALLGR